MHVDIIGRLYHTKPIYPGSCLSLEAARKLEGFHIFSAEYSSSAPCWLGGHDGLSFVPKP